MFHGILPLSFRWTISIQKFTHVLAYDDSHCLMATYGLLDENDHMVTHLQSD